MGLYPDILNEPVSRLSSREVITADPATTVRAAVRDMHARQIG